MKSSLKNIWKKLFKEEITFSYDSCNNEISKITDLYPFSGVSTEISKTLTPNIQIRHISIINSNETSKQLIGNLSFYNMLWQINADQDKNLQIRGTHIYKNILSKFNYSQITNREKYIHFEFDIKNKYNNLCFKLFKRLSKELSSVGILNFMQKIGNLSIGTEVIKVENGIGLSFSSRFEILNSIFTVSLHQFNVLSADLYYKLNEMIDFGLKFSTSKDSEVCYGLGIRVYSNRGEVIGSLNSSRQLCLSFNDKLGEGIYINASCRLEKNNFIYGYGFTYEF
ncbi:translocase of outer mitochondrial membrane 40-like protein [Vairimorpha apis BRL 01]|uniref:Translocase of outer mitochondrial membrane 40-like protein n=1 Tax=Vairimorpha apis BRL 01 TaxID=1037528 RepID=T0MDI2_9MICR|nr:translocase of outer mitochondrial membrane 40-like protein [Vairimorpha apis BRL 01]